MRTTGIRLIADYVAYKRGTREAKREIKDFKNEVEGLDKAGRRAGDGIDKAGEAGKRAGRDFSQAGKSADRMGASFDSAGKSAGRMGDELTGVGRISKRELARMRESVAEVDRQIAVTRRNLAGLSTVMSRGGGGEDIVKTFRAQQSQLNLLKDVRRFLPNPDEAEKAGQKMGQSVFIGFMRVSRPFAVALGGIAVAASPFIGAVIAGAVVGAAGLGGVVGGLILAGRDARVKAAAASLGQEVMRGLTTRADVFIGPALQGVQRIRDAWHAFDADLTRIFNSSSKLVSPLIDGLVSGLLRLGRGIANAVVAAKPVIDQWARFFDEVLGAVGDTFTTMGEHAKEGALGVHDLTDATVDLIHTLNAIIGPLATVYGWLSKANTEFKDFTNGMSILDTLMGPLFQLADTLLEVTGITKAAPKAFGEWHDGVARVGAGAAAAVVPIASFGDRMRAATAATKAFSDEIHKVFSDQLSLDRALLDLAEGAKTVHDELTRGTRTLSLNSAEGRKNRGVLIDQLARIEDLRQARVAETGSVQVATAEYSKNIRNLRAAALAAGYNKGEVDKLIGSYRKVPGRVNTTIGTPGLPQSDAGIKGYDKKLDALARKVNTNITVTGKRKAEDELKSLLILQRALKGGTSVSAATSAFNKQEAKAFDKGGYTGAGAKHQPAGIVHAGEFVFNKQATSKLGVNQLDQMHKSAQMPGYADGGPVINAPFPTSAAMTRIPSRAEVMSAIMGAFGNWPSSPAAQRGDSGVWRRILAVTRAAGFNAPLISAYRPGDPKWHGSGRADDFGGFNQDALASFWAAKRPLELIHRSAKRDYAYTRGVNKGSFNEGLMNAHRNHVHVAMAGGGVIREPVFGVGASGRTYSLAENGPETVIPGTLGGGGVTIMKSYTINVRAEPLTHPAEIGAVVIARIQAYEKNNGTTWRTRGTP